MLPKRSLDMLQGTLLFSFYYTKAHVQIANLQGQTLISLQILSCRKTAQWG